MKKLSIIILLLINVSAFAQKKSFQFDVGLNRSWFTYDENFLNDYKTDFIPKFSISINHSFVELGDFNTSIGIRYYHLGRSTTLDFGNAREETARLDHYLISLPLRIKYNVHIINTNIILNAEASYIATSNSKAPNPINNITTERNITDEMNRLLFSVGAGVEYTFDISDETFGVNAIFNYTLTKIPKDGMFRDSDNQEYSWVSYKAMEIVIFLSYYF